VSSNLKKLGLKRKTPVKSLTSSDNDVLHSSSESSGIEKKDAKCPRDYFHKINGVKKGKDVRLALMGICTMK